MPGRRVALLVATSMYGDPGLRGLRAPAGEAEDLKQLLETQGGFDDVGVLRNESKSRIEYEIEGVFSSAGPDDQVLLYMSCHGLRNDRGQLLFAACNTELAHAESTAVSSDFVRSQLNTSQAGMKVLLLDCCYSGAFSVGLIPKAAEEVDLGELVGQGTCVLTATSSFEYAFEGGEFTGTDAMSSSLFTRAVLDGIRSGAADADGDGLISTDELYRYVRRELAGRQTPWLESRMVGSFYIARTASTAPETIRPAPPAAQQPIRRLLEHPTAQRNGPAGCTLRVVVGSDVDGQPFLLNLEEPHNHLAVVGPTQSGKSQFVRMLLLALALDSNPAEARFHIVDSESRFGAFAPLPHVGAVLGPDQSTHVERLVEAVEREIAQRRAMFRTAGFETLVDFRVARRNRDLPTDDDQQDVFLVIDRWEAFADENPSLVPRVERIADQGNSFGVHLVVAARSWSKISDEIRQHLRGRVEFAPGRSAHASSHGGSFQVAVPKPGDPGAQHGGMLSLIEQVAGGSEQPTRTFDLPRILGVDVMAVAPSSAWRAPDAPDWLRVPIGLDEYGRLVHLDLKPAATGGAGPHGMIVGQPGSGASQTLGSLLLLLMLTHPPNELNVAALRGLPYDPYQELIGMPHVAAHLDVSSFVESKVDLSRRLKDIRREVARRRNSQHGAPDWPRLVVAVHNFVEALAHQKDAAEQLREVMTLGADVGVHVVLLAHSLADSGFPEIEELCHFRIVHRTATDQDSIAALGTSAAAELDTSTPGHGFFLERSGPATKFRAWIPGEDRRADLVARVNEAVPVRAAELRSPLAEPFGLDELLGIPTRTERGLSAVDFERRAEIPIGLVDVFEEGRTEALTVSVGRNIAISGGAFSGKAFLARTAVLSMALTHTPEELVCYFIGRGDGYSCGDVLSDLPHVGAVATLQEGELVGVIVGHMHELLVSRQRESREDQATVLLVVEQWNDFGKRFSWLVPNIVELARSGPRHGIQVVISSGEWSAADRDLIDQCPTRLDLGDGSPGVGAVGGRAFRAALPWVGPDADLRPESENTRLLARQIAQLWTGPQLPRLSLPPALVSYEEAAAVGSPHIVLGKLTGPDRWAEFDLDRTPHLLCLGEPGSGKTNLLRVVLTELARLHTPDDYNVVIVDPKRGLLGEFDGPQFSYAAVREDFERALHEAAVRIEQRLGDHGKPRRKVFLVLSDFELIAHNSELVHADLLARLTRLLEHGPGLGLHLIVTRNSINIGAALHEGLLGGLRSAGCAMVVLSSEDSDEEFVPGVRSTNRPPGRGRYLLDETTGTIQLAYLAAP
ncbi:caspase family protein [Saccharopolyspora sp. K220]|uniref:caspase, EACC1-associated type n=1 Tax=Saccharopolyspora soli TaxID=2926618 RepID=UPI001F5860BB|nr:FtsK/SpoIIIE domain-containing protein [Saccharopolyspora soli]MCI2423255.1 caspase family protein [Saccharopolyspora soli]